MKSKLTKTLIRIEKKYDALLEEMNSENEGGMVDVALACELADSVPFLIDQILELERVNKQLKNNLSVYKGYYKNTLKINEDVIEENKKHRQALYFLELKLSDFKKYTNKIKKLSDEKMIKDYAVRFSADISETEQALKEENK